MITAADGYALLDELSPGNAYNTGAVNATLESDVTPIPGFEDSLTDFTSEGPARLTSDLKPDISAPGFDILSTAAGTGTEGIKLSGTSMAAPMVSGVAALLKQIHPNWDPGRIKAVMMNQATRDVANNDLSKPAPASVMGAGRVRADESAEAVTVAEPGSLSYGLQHLTAARSLTRHFKVSNRDKKDHDYTVSGNLRYSDFDPAATTVAVSTNGDSFGASKSFKVKKHEAKKIYVRLTQRPRGDSARPIRRTAFTRSTALPTAPSASSRLARTPTTSTSPGRRPRWRPAPTASPTTTSTCQAARRRRR